MIVERIDRYTVLVNGHRIRATHNQEAQLREMNEEEQARFLHVMGIPDAEE